MLVFTGILSCTSSWIGTDNTDFKIQSNDVRLGRTITGIVTYDTFHFSGSIIDYFSNGQINTERNYRDGKQHGKSMAYYENGVMAYLRPYNNGEKHGVHSGWYSDGKLKYQYTFTNGLSEGTHSEWYSDGNLFKQMNYTNGFEFGSQKVWRKDRKLRANYVVRENGRKYGLPGIKRCTNIDTRAETFDRITENTNDFSR